MKLIKLTKNIGVNACCLLALLMSSSTFADPPPLDPDGIKALNQETGGKAEVKLNRSHGAARFVNIKPGQTASLTSFKGASAKETLDYFLSKHGKLFGIGNPASDLKFAKSNKDNLGFSQLFYQQLYKGIPVYGASLVGNVNAAGDLRSVNGRIIPNLSVNTIAKLSSATASEIALKEMQAEAKQTDATSQPVFTVKNSRLVIYNPSIYEDRPGTSYLAYKVQVSGGLTSKVVLVDADSGFVLDKINLRPEALYRRVYDSNQTDVDIGSSLDFPKTYPQKPYWAEGAIFPTLDPFALPDPSYKSTNDALSATQYIYNLYNNTFGIDTPDRQGRKMDIILNYTPGNAFAATDAYPAMYTAFGIEAANDDTVAHEWQHWYTNFSGLGLDYLNQAGALNEAYSDIFGETIDFLNSGTAYGGLDLPNSPRSTGMCSLYSKDSPAARLASLTINTPPSIAGQTDEVSAAGFGPLPPLTGLTGDVVVVDDGSTALVNPGQEPYVSIYDGCQTPFLTPVSGKIALIKRGNCNFTVKVANAQAQGATGVIIYNRDDEVTGMGGNDPSLTIPSVLIRLSLGEAITNASKTNTVNVTLFGKLDPQRFTDNTIRWVLFEDDGGSTEFGRGLRDMWDPTCFDYPGKVSDTQYVCGKGDTGGVHTNSSVPNHGFALVVDGGTYNGQTISGIGLTKAVHIYHRAQESYQTFSMNFADHADALAQACSDLTGQPLKMLGATSLSGEVITANDCANVEKAMVAVEMRQAPRCLPTAGFASISGVEMVEGNSGTTPMVFKVKLSGISDKPVSLDYEAVTLPEFNPVTSADNGTDYLPSKGTLVIPAGSQEGSITVLIKGDKQKEGNERFQLYIKNVVNAEFTSSPYGVILNDD